MEPDDQPVTLREARRSDLAAIVAMLADDPLGRARENPGPPLDPRYEAAYARMEADPNQILLAAETEGRLIGCLQISVIPGLSRLGLLRGQIESVRVARSARGLGVGRALLLRAIEECRSRGCGLVQLTSDKSRPDAIRFYRELGFVDSHEGLKLSLDQP